MAVDSLCLCSQWWQSASCGISGMDVTVARRHLLAIKLQRPDIVVLELGTNDMCSAVDTVDTIGNVIHSIACKIRDNFGVQHVVASQILRRACAPNYRTEDCAAPLFTLQDSKQSHVTCFPATFLPAPIAASPLGSTLCRYR